LVALSEQNNFLVYEANTLIYEALYLLKKTSGNNGLPRIIAILLVIITMIMFMVLWV